MKSKNPKKEKKDTVEISTDPQEQIQKLEEKIDALAKEKDELFEKLQRVSADYTNFQKRAPKQISDSIAYEKKNLMRSLLPSLDNFEHALAGLEKAESIEDVVKGIKMVHQHLLDALKAHGVEPIKAACQQCAPSMHEAMMRKTDENQPDNIVLEEFQKGYKLNGQVLRPSKVIVNKLTTEETTAAGDDDSTGQE